MRVARVHFYLVVLASAAVSAIAAGCSEITPKTVQAQPLGRATRVAGVTVHDVPGLRGEGTAAKVGPVILKVWNRKTGLPPANGAGTATRPGDLVVHVWLRECGTRKSEEYERQLFGPWYTALFTAAADAERSAPREVVTLSLTIHDGDSGTVYECEASGESKHSQIDAAEQAAGRVVGPLRKYLKKR